MCLHSKKKTETDTQKQALQDALQPSRIDAKEWHANRKTAVVDDAHVHLPSKDDEFDGFYSRGSEAFPIL